MSADKQYNISSSNNNEEINKNIDYAKTSKRKVLIESILGQLENTLEFFKNEKKIEPIDFVEILTVKEIQNKKYRKIKYPYEALFKTIILMDMIGKNQSTIVEYLQNRKRYLKKLGLPEVPDQSNLSRFINHGMDEEARIIRSFIKNNIIDLSKKAGINLGIYRLDVKKPDKKDQTSNKGLSIKKGLKTKEIARYYKNKLLTLLGFNGNKNEIYHDEDMVDVLINIGLERRCAENVCNMLRAKGKKAPISDAFLRRIKDMDADDIMDDFDLLGENLLETIRRERLYDRSVKLAVDFTDHDYYGKGTPMTHNKVKINSKGKKIKCKCFRYIVMDIVEPEGSYTLKALPYSPLAKKEEHLYKLLKYAKKKLKIKLVLMDRGFFTIECIKVLKRLDLKFLMPAVRNPKIKKKEPEMTTPGILSPFSMGDVDFDLIKIRDEEDEKDRLFATNMDFDVDDPKITKKLLSIYSKRWRIENGFKVKKTEFYPKTTSNNFNIRLYYFLFTCFIYNLWILARILINLTVYGKKRTKNEITAYIFIELLLDPG